MLVVHVGFSLCMVLPHIQLHLVTLTESLHKELVEYTLEYHSCSYVCNMERTIILGGEQDEQWAESMESISFIWRTGGSHTIRCNQRIFHIILYIYSAVCQASYIQ